LIRINYSVTYSISSNLMSHQKSLLDFLNKFIPLSLNEYNELIAPCIIKRHFDKKSIITTAGEVENYINFIDSGLVRKYYKKANDEVNTQISNEGHIIHAQEPTELSSMTYECLEKMYSSSEKMQRLGRLVITATMVLKDKWLSQLVKLSPRERFISFVTKHPELMQRVPQKYLASYLNIKPETFSRFKHLVKDHSKKTVVYQN